MIYDWGGWHSNERHYTYGWGVVGKKRERGEVWKINQIREFFCLLLWSRTAPLDNGGKYVYTYSGDFIFDSLK